MPRQSPLRPSPSRAHAEHIVWQLNLRSSPDAIDSDIDGPLPKTPLGDEIFMQLSDSPALTDLFEPHSDSSGHQGLANHDAEPPSTSKSLTIFIHSALTEGCSISPSPPEELLRSMSIFIDRGIESFGILVRFYVGAMCVDVKMAMPRQ